MENRTIETPTALDSDIDRTLAGSSKDHIPGWGHDADPENDPTYPMKHRNGADYERLNYEKPEQQPLTVEVLHSIERPTVSRVFGTSTPPSGLSGKIRRLAFKKSESTYAHWFPLVVADRINVIEGIIDDIKQGHFPNLIAEVDGRQNGSTIAKVSFKSLRLQQLLQQLPFRCYQERKRRHRIRKTMLSRKIALEAFRAFGAICFYDCL